MAQPAGRPQYGQYYLTRCSCGRQTTKGYARTHGGLCMHCNNTAHIRARMGKMNAHIGKVRIAAGRKLNEEVRDEEATVMAEKMTEKAAMREPSRFDAFLRSLGDGGAFWLLIWPSLFLIVGVTITLSVGIHSYYSHRSEEMRLAERRELYLVFQGDAVSFQKYEQEQLKQKVEALNASLQNVLSSSSAMNTRSESVGALTNALVRLTN